MCFLNFTDPIADNGPHGWVLTYQHEAPQRLSVLQQEPLFKQSIWLLPCRKTSSQ